MKREKLQPSEVRHLRNALQIAIDEEVPAELVEMAEIAKAAQGRVGISGLSIHVLAMLAVHWNERQKSKSKPKPKAKKKESAVDALEKAAAGSEA